MKTPMQEHIEWLKKEKDEHGYEKHPYFECAIEHAEAMLEKEKEHIVLSHINGQSEFDNGAYRQEVIRNAEQYYNKTFKTKDCKIIRCEDPMVCLRGCSVHEQTCKHPIYER
jgi:hypothetical protein